MDGDSDAGLGPGTPGAGPPASIAMPCTPLWAAGTAVPQDESESIARATSDAIARRRENLAMTAPWSVSVRSWRRSQGDASSPAGMAGAHQTRRRHLPWPRRRPSRPLAGARLPEEGSPPGCGVGATRRFRLWASWRAAMLSPLQARLMAEPQQKADHVPHDEGRSDKYGQAVRLHPGQDQGKRQDACEDGDGEKTSSHLQPPCGSRRLSASEQGAATACERRLGYCGAGTRTIGAAVSQCDEHATARALTGQPP